MVMDLFPNATLAKMARKSGGYIAFVDGIIVWCRWHIDIFAQYFYFVFGTLLFLEDSGYMARVACVKWTALCMDCHSESFYSDDSGFGVFGAGSHGAGRVSYNKDRMKTTLLCQCSARLNLHFVFADVF